MLLKKHANLIENSIPNTFHPIIHINIAWIHKLRYLYIIICNKWILTIWDSCDSTTSCVDDDYYCCSALLAAGQMPERERAWQRYLLRWSSPPPSLWHHRTTGGATEAWHGLAWRLLWYIKCPAWPGLHSSLSHHTNMKCMVSCSPPPPPPAPPSNS